jgi:hypothetical protein
LFLPHDVSWSEQQPIETAAPSCSGDVVRVIREIGTSDLTERTPMKKDQVDLENKVVWIPDSKTPDGIADVPLTDLAVEAPRDQEQLAGTTRACFRATTTTPDTSALKTAWRLTLRRPKVPYFPHLRSALNPRTRLSAGGMADEWVTQLLRQDDRKCPRSTRG